MTSQLYLEIGLGQQVQVLKLIKEHSKLSWNKIAEILKVKKRMVFFYLKEKSRLPLNRLLILAKQTNFDLDAFGKLKTTEKGTYKPQKILKPPLDERLAEFLGALSGDGNIDPKNHRVCITCNAITDFEYVTKAIRNMFADLFGAQTTINTQNGAVRCQVYSKELADYLESLGIPKGNRKNRTFIPTQILENEELQRAFLRGVFDTDGSFYGRREHSAVVEYISCSPKFLLQIKKSLIRLGLKATLSGKSVRIYDQKEVDTFFKVIKPNNPKHRLKYAVFKKIGKVPMHKELVFALVEQRLVYEPSKLATGVQIPASALK